MVDDCNTTIMEVFEQTKDVPLSLENPIRIPPAQLWYPWLNVIDPYTHTWTLKETRVFSENTPISMCHAPTSTTYLNRQTVCHFHSQI